MGLSGVSLPEKGWASLLCCAAQTKHEQTKPSLCLGTRPLMMPPTTPLAFLGHAALVSGSKQQKPALSNLNRKGFFTVCHRFSGRAREPGPKGAPSQEQRPKAHAKSGLVQTPPALALTTDPSSQANAGRRGVAVTSTAPWHLPSSPQGWEDQ